MSEDFTLWMGDIEPWMDKLFIKKSFNYYGFKPKSIKIIRNISINENKQFCFVNFKNFQEAKNALLNLNAKIIPNTKLIFKLNFKNNDNNLSALSQNYKNIYVGNLSPKITNIELYNIFKARYPSVYYVSIISDNGIPKGYGFVHFSNDLEYYRCLKEMDGLIIDNKKIKVREKNNNDKDNNINDYFNDNNSESKDLVESSKSNIFECKDFSKNIDILESNNIQLLYKKAEESVNKIYKHYKELNKLDQLSKLIIYYISIYK